MIRKTTLIWVVFLFASHIKAQNKEITCSDNGCRGVYRGPEFINGSDVAHQFSNHMSAKVGDQLKALYRKKKYVKVDLDNLTMTTKGMDNRGSVVYTLEVPFVQVSDSCKAFTAFDHRGGWGHKITLSSVEHIFKEKNNLAIKEISTPEGLQEFWVQWRHERWQPLCW